MKAASAAWAALGVPDHMGYSQIGAHSHCAFPSNQQASLTAFIQKFFFGQSTNTTIMQSDFTFNQSQWVDWTTPSLT